VNKKKTTIQRLSLIKYLYINGINQSYKSEPFYGLSILNFHDSVELYLELLAEEFGFTKTKNIGFIKYWELISQKGTNLPLKTSMEKLNTARVSLKHSGLIPSKIDIEFFRAITTEFFEETSESIFKMKFKDISIVDYIKFDKVKNYLKLAESKFNEGNKKETLENLALSFHYLLNDYEESARAEFNYSPFSFGRLEFLTGLSEIGQFSRNIYESINTLKNSTIKMQNVLRVISFGIDYIKYIKFNSITPIICYSLKSKEPVAGSINEEEISSDNFEFCRDFIIESALKLQEHDILKK